MPATLTSAGATDTLGNDRSDDLGDDPSPAGDRDDLVVGGSHGEGGEPPLGDPAPDPSAQWARRVFWVAVVVSVPIIGHLGRGQWFSYDEWDFLATRGLSDPAGLFEPHNDHWTTLPIVVYRLLYEVVGLHHYWPYQAVSIASHLGVVILLRATMIRVRTDPWLATALSVLLLFLGSGADNITWAFQITFTGAMVLGLGQMLLADGDRSRPLWDRRDGLALLCGLGAIMCSGVGVSMVVGVGVAVLLRRGWRPALVQTVPLGLVYAIWHVVAEPPTDNAQDATVRSVADYAREMVTNAYVQMGGSALWAVALALLVAAGVGVGIGRRSRARGHEALGRIPRVPPLVAGTLASAAAFVVTTSVGRASVADLGKPTVGRYVYLVVALTLPAIGLALSPLVRRRAWARVIVVVFVLAGLPTNLADFRATGDERFLVGFPDAWSQAATLAAEGTYPASHQPDELLAPEVTMGWLEQAVADGKMPTASTVDPTLKATIDLATSLTTAAGPPVAPCRWRPLERGVEVNRGQQLRVRAPQVTVIIPSIVGPLASATFLGAEDAVALRVLRGPLRLRLEIPPGTVDRFQLCG